ncbi:hypothetical protein PPTG_23821 [Phytophthora nicotianae INRA-310]|uniref:Uncharacterized protein n=1 Tax=Phytophthora nicotianae (strain INRA-310) TaxID=761204 RepID=W2PTK4_PHYN3|nr:hypothetical protein PPTG_23821 [Phytophthora nicotianae INRA-310]ETN03335.1 hypothetical protein PPTG_23821 [Phytophthora nicotianae INRA-310]
MLCERYHCSLPGSRRRMYCTTTTALILRFHSAYFRRQLVESLLPREWETVSPLDAKVIGLKRSMLSDSARNAKQCCLLSDSRPMSKPGASSPLCVVCTIVADISLEASTTPG